MTRTLPTIEKSLPDYPLGASDLHESASAVTHIARLLVEQAEEQLAAEHTATAT